MPTVQAAALLERLVLTGVALTTRALVEARPGLDLTFPQWRVLVLLGDAPSGATVSKVAAGVGVTLPAVSRQLRRLQRRNLVDVAPDTADRRATRARLTSEGRAARDAILDFRRRMIAAAAAEATITEATFRELAALADALERQR